MKAISRALYQLLTHSYITLFGIITTTAVFMTILHCSTSRGIDNDNALNMVLVMTLTLSMFFGIYFAGALVSLRNFYLWHINRKYKRSLLLSVLILGALLSIMLGPYLYKVVSSNLLIVLLPASLMFFCMYVLLGNNLMHKVLIPITPGILYYLYTKGISETIVLTLLMTATIALIIYMFMQRTQFKQVSMINDFMAMSNVPQAQVSPNFWITFNKSIGSMFNRSILNGKQQLDWMISMPSTKTGLLALFNGLVIIAMFVFLGPQKEDVFVLMMLAMTMLSVSMECRKLIKQVKSVAHVFPGEKHYTLKNKILFAADKIVLWNTLVFTSPILGYLYITDAQIDYIILLGSCLSIIMLTMALQPFFLTLTWVNVNFVLLIAVVAYFILIMITLATLRYILQTEHMLTMSVAFLLVLFGIRSATEHYFSKRPLEKLVR